MNKKTMKNATIAERILDFFARHPGRHKTSKIAEAIGATVSATSKALSELAKNGEITKIKNGTYSGNGDGVLIDAQTELSKARKKFSSDARSAENNEQTINTLLNTYDEVLAIFQVWVLQNIASQKIDFEQQLLFIENFKWLTIIADKLMKRWSLVHVGYDTNTRQAQEDAKAKTEARQKEALENAPLEDTIMVVGSYDPEAKALIDCIPSSALGKLTDEETDDIKV